MHVVGGQTMNGDEAFCFGAALYAARLKFILSIVHLSLLLKAALQLVDGISSAEVWCPRYHAVSCEHRFRDGSGGFSD
jgi:hypothetical protein